MITARNTCQLFELISFKVELETMGTEVEWRSEGGGRGLGERKGGR